MKTDPSETIPNILKVHRQYRPKHSLDKALGDGFLTEHNPIFKNVREAFIKEDFHFVHKDHFNATHLYYFALPHYIQSKSVYVHNNVAPLEFLEREAPKKFNLFDLNKTGLKLNILLHEAGHCAIHTTLFKNHGLDKSLPKTSENIFKIFLSEGFTCSNEIFSDLYVKDPLHRFFHNINSSRKIESPFVRSTLEKGINLCGIENVFRLHVIATTSRYFSIDKIDKKGLLQICQAVGIPKSLVTKNYDTMSFIFHGAKINQEFNLVNTPLFLKYIGFNKPFLSLIDFNFLDMLEEVDDLRKVLDRMSQITLTTHPKSPL